MRGRPRLDIGHDRGKEGAWTRGKRREAGRREERGVVSVCLKD